MGGAWVTHFPPGIVYYIVIGLAAVGVGIGAGRWLKAYIDHWRPSPLD